MTTTHRVAWAGKCYTYVLNPGANTAELTFAPKKGEVQQVRTDCASGAAHMRKMVAKWRTYQKQRATRLRKKEEAHLEAMAVHAEMYGAASVA